MTLRDVLEAGARIWFKSEWGPADQDWPAVSFTKQSVGHYLRQQFRPGRDAIVYVGTSNPATTAGPEHRQRLLSAVNIEPAQLLETRECVSPESWKESQENFRGRWIWSMPALNIWQFDEFASAYAVAPSTYSQLGAMQNRGNVVEVLGAERDAVLALPVHVVPFRPHYRTGNFSESRAILNLSRSIHNDIGRLAGKICGNVAASGLPWTGVRPTRTTEADPHRMLALKWIEQRGRCFLCNGALSPETKNYLLQSSCDRLDSTDNAYSRDNTHITHLGCNLAKNKVSLPDFEEWIAVVRGDSDDASDAAVAASAQ